MPTEVMSAVRMQPVSQLQHHSPVLPIRLLTRGPEYLRRQIETGTPARSTLSAVERLAADKAKYVKSQKMVGAGGSSASESSSASSSRSSSKSQQDADGTPGSLPDAPVRRGSSKRLLRPDSLVIYRQKNRGEAAEEARTGLVRRLFLGSAKEKPIVSIAPSSAESRNDRTPIKERPEPRSRTGLHRSQSDISSRYSRSFSDFDTFFKYCGLEPEVVEELGKDRFTAAPEDTLDNSVGHRLRSASVATSDSGFSRRSGGEGSNGGQQEDEPLSGHLPGSNSNTSVIERNARIIKWLYSCKKAKETRGASPDLP
ncbi:protein FAM110C [Leptodactylus fuscus]|uniref:protein FAM110C n=1 Tax=Leptodactylus fuscus TaxID=238119 RepID=UPI003F4F0496